MPGVYEVRLVTS